MNSYRRYEFHNAVMNFITKPPKEKKINHVIEIIFCVNKIVLCVDMFLKMRLFFNSSSFFFLVRFKHVKGNVFKEISFLKL